MFLKALVVGHEAKLMSRAVLNCLNYIFNYFSLCSGPNKLVPDHGVPAGWRHDDITHEKGYFK